MIGSMSILPPRPLRLAENVRSARRRKALLLAGLAPFQLDPADRAAIAGKLRK
jgi:hypothetical protein